MASQPTILAVFEYQGFEMDAALTSASVKWSNYLISGIFTLSFCADR